MSKRVLITPLNWGLGHASRCIPIINTLIDFGMTPILASDGDALILLQKEFPQLITYKLPSYNIRYEKSSMIFNMATQIHKIIGAIVKEHKAIEKIVKKESIDIIISDNRYGCRSKKCFNIFMTHQLNIKIPFWPLERIVGMGNKWMIDQFDCCWVPDFPSERSLAGSLSDRSGFSKVKYIGPVSRMTTKFKVEKQYDCIVVLSGPEPQRTYLESLILNQAYQLPYKILLIQGITSLEESRKQKGNVEILPYLTTQDLNKAILSSEVVICRSGYSSIMDLTHLGKKAILIPTPGQTEQEYLAQRFDEKTIYVAYKQDKFNMKEAMEKVKQYQGVMLNENENLIVKEVKKLHSLPKSI